MAEINNHAATDRPLDVAPVKPSSPYGNAFSSALSSALVAALVVGGADVLLTLRAATEVNGKQAFQFAAVTLSLYGAVALIAGVLQGIVGGAIAATHPLGFGSRLWRRLVSDVELDKMLTAGILAACVSALAYALAVDLLAMRLVGNVERKGVGALLLGGVAVVSLPIFVLATYPCLRVTRFFAPLIPRLGRLPRAALTIVLLASFGAVVGLYIIKTRLDWRALKLATPLSLLAFAAVQVAWLALIHGPLAERRKRSTHGRLILYVLVAVAFAAPILTIATVDPDERTVALLTVESRGGKTLVAIARSFFDHDGDGYSTILGGGDCNDNDPTIHPGARDIPDDGIDQNCMGGDAHAPPPPPEVPAVAPGAPESAAQQFGWKGNVVIIAVDTLRADRLGVAGYVKRGGKSLTPRMDALAASGAYFKRVYAQAPNTPRSFPSMFTSRYPSQVHWDKVFASYSTVLPDNVTLFEALHDGGLHTVGESSHFYFTAERGITQGFDEYDNDGAKNIKDSNHDSAAPRIAPRVVAKLAALAKGKQRFVLFTHFFEPHSTYMEHEEFPIHEKGLEGLEEKYDYEIAFVDKYVGQVLDGIAAAGLGDDTMVILLSDHGEGFGTHSIGGEKMFFHGQTLYEELLRVPLIVHIPGVPARTIDQPVMLLDMAPTILDAVKVKIPPSFQGRSLLPAILGDPLPPRAVHAELLPAPDWNHDAKMMIDAEGKTKLIYKISDNLFELFDLTADPGEQKNLMHETGTAHKDLAATMKQGITSWMESEL